MDKPIGIAHLEIPQSWIMHKPLYWYECNNPDKQDSYNAMRKEFKKLTGYTFDNSFLKWSNIYGHLFAISVYADGFNKKWIITIWDSTGNTTVDCINFPIVDLQTDYLPDDIYNRMKKNTELFSNGKVTCSGCKKEQDYQDIKRQKYFAGIYCNECWETKWKAIEAKETYE